MNETLTKPGASLTTRLPPMTYGDLCQAMEMVTVDPRHRQMIPYLISALQQQSPFLSGTMIMFEILRSANCLADVGPPPVPDG